MIKSVLTFAALTLLAGCSHSVVPPFDSVGGTGEARHGGTPIKHAVFIVQENRSFNNLFLGFPGATTAKYGYDESGDKIKIRPRDLAEPWDIGHFSGAFFKACDGRESRVERTARWMAGWAKAARYRSPESGVLVRAATTD